MNNSILIDFTTKDYMKFAFISVDVNFRKLSQDEQKLFSEVSQKSFKTKLIYDELSFWVEIHIAKWAKPGSLALYTTRVVIKLHHCMGRYLD